MMGTQHSWSIIEQDWAQYVHETTSNWGGLSPLALITTDNVHIVWIKPESGLYISGCITHQQFPRQFHSVVSGASFACTWLAKKVLKCRKDGFVKRQWHWMSSGGSTQANASTSLDPICSTLITNMCSSGVGFISPSRPLNLILSLNSSPS